MIRFEKHTGNTLFALRKEGLPLNVRAWVTPRARGDGWSQTDEIFIFHHTKAKALAEIICVEGYELDYYALPPYLVASITKALPIWEAEKETRARRVLPPPLPLDMSSHYEALWLMPDAPRAVVTAAYRALAKEHHPDHGGKTEDMVRISSAYKAIKDTW